MKSVEINGNLVEYRDYGSGKPMVFIHGAFSSGNTWRKMIPRLSNTFLCIVPEWPFGGHRVPFSEKFDFTPDGIANLIFKFITTLGIKECIIVCNDTGGAYGQVFVSNHMDIVSHLILSNCEGFDIFPPKKFQSLTTMVKIPGYLWLLARLFAFKPSLKLDLTFGLLSNSLNQELLYEFYVKNFVESASIRKDFKKMAIHWSPTYTNKAATQLERFDKPVLIVWGVDDLKLFPVELGRRLESIFSNATFVEANNAKTFIQEDNPEVFVNSILQFLN